MRDQLVEMEEWKIRERGGAPSLCLAAMGLNDDAVRKFLNTPGVDATSADEHDHSRSPLHCLSLVWVYGDSLRDSYIFALLTDHPHWCGVFHLL